jgi:hypothetical protein
MDGAPGCITGSGYRMTVRSHISKLTKGVTLAVLLLALTPAGWGRQDPHYVFVLPDGYTGWIQIIFASPHAPKPESSHNGFVFRLNDSGILRTSILNRSFPGSQDEFFYRRFDRKGNEVLVPVPAEFVCTGNSGLDNCFISDDSRVDAFVVSRTSAGHASDGTPGTSWFLFVGPYPLREKMARHAHFYTGTTNKMDVPEDDPTPGRIKDDK